MPTVANSTSNHITLALINKKLMTTNIAILLRLLFSVSQLKSYQLRASPLIAISGQLKNISKLLSQLHNKFFYFNNKSRQLERTHIHGRYFYDEIVSSYVS